MDKNDKKENIKNKEEVLHNVADDVYDECFKKFQRVDSHSQLDDEMAGTQDPYLL